MRARIDTVSYNRFDMGVILGYTHGTGVILVYTLCAGGYIQGEHPWRGYIPGEKPYQSGYATTLGGYALRFVVITILASW